MDLIKDDVRKLYYNFLVPAVSGAVAVAAYSIVDTIAIGQGVGVNGTAACALVTPIFSIANFIALICGVGGSVLMSRSRGGGNSEKGNAYFTASIVVVSVLTIAAWISCVLFQEQFYRLFGADDVLMPYAKEYGEWIFAFMPSFVMTAFLGCFVRTDGSPRFVMVSTLIGGVVNIIGDWLFVFPLNMGMAGAAIATVMGSVIQALLLLGYILLGKTSMKPVKPFKWMPAFKKTMVTGFGAGISALSIIAVSFIANNQIMKYAGGAALAVYGILSTVSALFTSIFSGIGQATQPIVSENYGAGNPKRYWKAEKLGMKSAILFGALFSAVSIAFPVEVVAFFMKITPEVEEVAPYIMRVFSLSYIPQAVSVFCIYYLPAITHPKMATAISLLRGIILNSAFLMLFPFLFGSNGIWWAILIGELVTMLLTAFYMIVLYRRYLYEEKRNVFRTKAN